MFWKKKSHGEELAELQRQREELFAKIERLGRENAEYKAEYDENTRRIEELTAMVLSKEQEE